MHCQQHHTDTARAAIHGEGEPPAAPVGGWMTHIRLEFGTIPETIFDYTITVSVSCSCPYVSLLHTTTNKREKYNWIEQRVCEWVRERERDRERERYCVGVNEHDMHHALLRVVHWADADSRPGDAMTDKPSCPCQFSFSHSLLLLVL